MKISVLLPYKENFSPANAGAVSLFVKDIIQNSKFSKKSFLRPLTIEQYFIYFI